MIAANLKHLLKKVNVSSNSKDNVMSNPSSPKSRTAFSPLRRDGVNRSQIIKSASSVLSSPNSKEYINPVLLQEAKPMFGFVGYRIQPTFYEKARQVSFSKGTKKSWVDLEAKKKAGIPDPGTYTYKEKVSNKTKFLQGKRITEIQEYIKQNNWKLPPGAHYKDKPEKGSSVRRGKGLMDSKESRSSYLDDSLARAQMTPSHIYKCDSNLTRVRQPFAKIFKKGTSKSLLKDAPQPVPKDLNHVDAFYKTQVKNTV